MRLFDRDRRSVALTPAGAALLPPTRALLERAEDLQRRAAQMSGSEPVRLGYTSWLPADLTARTSAVAQLRTDAWIEPSHAQAARVADGSLDLAVCWVRTQDLQQYGLSAGSSAPTASTRSPPVTTPAMSTPGTLPFSSMTTAPRGHRGTSMRQSWPVTPAPAHRISDGGITGPAFFDHVRRSHRPIVNSPKGQTAPVPPDLVRRAVIAPEVYWTWSLVWRRDEERGAVLAVVDALTDGVGDLGIHRPDAWLPDSDPQAVGLCTSASRFEAAPTRPRGSRSWRRSWSQPHGGVMDTRQSALPRLPPRRAGMTRHRECLANTLPMRCPANCPKTTL